MAGDKETLMMNASKELTELDVKVNCKVDFIFGKTMWI